MTRTPEPPRPSARRARDGLNRFTRDPDTVIRDARAAELRAQGWTYPRIAAELGFKNRNSAMYAVGRALAEIIREPAENALHFELERLDNELRRLDDLEASARTVLNARHITVSNGRVIIHPETGEPMEDDGPVLQALDRLLKIEDSRRKNGERRAKLHGLETLKIDATVHEVTQQDIELQEMLREAKAKTAAEEQEIRDGRET